MTYLLLLACLAVGYRVGVGIERARHMIERAPLPSGGQMSPVQTDDVPPVLHT